MKKRIIALLVMSLFLTACSNQATTSEPEPQTKTISTEAETEKETETSLLEEETTETEIEAEATKADEQLQSEAGQTTSEESNYTVTPMTATLYAQQAVNLRQGPGTNYDKTGSLSTNQSVEVTGYTDVASGKWYQLSNGSFVSSKYLSTDKVVIKTPTNNNSSNSGSNSNSDSNNSNSSGSSQSSSSSEGQTVDGSGSGDRSGTSRENRAGSDEGTGTVGGGNLQ